LHQRLIDVRRRHPWLQWARVEVETRTNEVLSYRCSSEGKALVVTLNLGDQPYRLSQPTRGVLLSEPGNTQPNMVPAHGFSVTEPAASGGG
jgi:hypothetical protein